MSYRVLERVFEWRSVRWLAAFAFLARGYFYRLISARYQAMNDFCWVVRVSRIEFFVRIAWSHVTELINETRRTGSNSLVKWYLESTQSKRCAATYTLSGGGPNDLFRDLIVLKATTPDEKGVLLMKYARTFEALVALMDFDRLLKHYTFVLEPCWAGYCDPAILMYFMPDNPVVVQSRMAEDFDFIAGIGAPYVPVRLGPADWVNADVFQAAPQQAKAYDLVMVANWGRHKRHAELFRALHKIGDRDLRVLLIGFPWSGRTSADIRREATIIANSRITLEIVEAVPHAEVARLVGLSKAFVFLTRKEGDNKAVVEALYADVPIIVYEHCVGGAASRVNPSTGILSSIEDLAGSICRVLDHRLNYSPRTWATENTGSSIATRVLNDALAQAVRQSGGRYTKAIAEKVNAPNLAYRDSTQRSEFRSDYDFIVSCLRHVPPSNAS